MDKPKIPKTEEREVCWSKGRKIITVVISPMTKEEARAEYPYRPVYKGFESRFGSNNTMVDDRALLLSEAGKRCKMCRAATLKEYLIDGICPDCDGRSEYNGTDPRQKV